MENNNKILIIDDDPDIVESLRIVLESGNYTVAAAESGFEGVKKAVAEKPDLILLDVMLEKIDTGFEVSRELRRLESTKHTPIIMITAIKELPDFNYKMAGSLSAGKNSSGYFNETLPQNETMGLDSLPVDFFYEKPIKPDLLLEKIASLLKKK